MKYVLSSHPYPPHDIWDGYYTGKKYTFQYEPYAICDISLENAKKYTTLNRAINACDRLNNTVVNYQFDVVEIGV